MYLMSDGFTVDAYGQARRRLPMHQRSCDIFVHLARIQFDPHRRFCSRISLDNGVTDDEIAGALQKVLDTPILAITDGTSNTILIGEDAGRPSLYQKGRGNTGVN